MSYLILGGDSLIGQALNRRLRENGAAVILTTRRQGPLAADQTYLDLSNPDWRPPSGIKTAFLCAAATSLEACEKDPLTSHIINVDSTVKIAKILHQQGVFVVFLSTNAVFDGSHSFFRADEPHTPICEYGRQKAEAESALFSLRDDVAVVRLTKVIASTLKLWADWVARLKAGQEIQAFGDFRMAPVSLNFAVDCLRRIGESRHSGVYQVSGAADISYLEAARCLAAKLGASSELVRAISVSSDEGPRLISRPFHTTLDMSAFASMGIYPPQLETVLNTVFA